MLKINTVTMEEKIKEVLDNHIDYYGTSKDDLAKELLNLFSVSGSTDIPKPYKWLKEEKWKIPQGATYYDPKVTLTQCAGWMTEYVKKYYR